MNNKKITFNKNLCKWLIVVFCALVILLTALIYCRIKYLEDHSGLLFYFKGCTVFNIQMFLTAFTLCFFWPICYFLFKRKTYRNAFLLAFALVFTVGFYFMMINGFSTVHYSYRTFHSPLGSNELVMVDKSFLHDSNYSLYVRQNKYLLREIDNAPLYELTPNFHWDEQVHSLIWIDETTVEIQALKSNERIRFSLE